MGLPTQAHPSASGARYASIGQRIASGCIDAAIAYFGAGMFVGGSLLAVSIALEDLDRVVDLGESGPMNEWIAVGIIVAIVVTCWIAYLGISNATGASVGKQILKLRLVDRNGDKLGPATAIARAVITLVFLFSGLILIDIAWILVDKQKRTLHDRMFGSFVVNYVPLARADAPLASG
jgi:uncharacterized RDD family membrane protein YckC